MYRNTMKTNQLASSVPRQLSMSIARDNEVFINTVAQHSRNPVICSFFLLTANKGKYLYQTDQ